MVLVLGAGTGLAKDASSAYIATDTECDEPIDLQVNDVTEAQDAYVWLKLGSTDIEDLAYNLCQGGELITGGAFVEECTSDDGKYTLAYPDLGWLADGTYTMKVYSQADFEDFSGDSFRLESD